jgi:hypothetical protein
MATDKQKEALFKANKTRSQKATFKAQRFVKAYVKNKFNGVKSIQEVYNPTTYGTAGSMACALLKKDDVRAMLYEELDKQGLSDEEIVKYHKQNLLQRTNISASNQAIDIYHKIKGNYSPEITETRSINLHLTPAQIDERLFAIQAEIISLLKVKNPEQNVHKIDTK